MFPRIPVVDVSEPYLSSTAGQSLRITGSPSTASITSPFSISFDVQIDVTVDSENYIGLFNN